jgi:hypothetical protein
LTAVLVVDRLSLAYPGPAGETLAVSTMVGWTSGDNAAIWSAWDGGFPAPWRTVVVHMLVDTAFIATYTPLLFVAATSWFRWTRVIEGAMFVLAAALIVVEGLEMWLLAAAALSLQAAEAGGTFPTTLGTTFGVIEPVKLTISAALILGLAIGGVVTCRIRSRARTR